MNRTPRLTRIAAALAAIALSGAAWAQPARVDLRPKFTKGQELRYRMTVHSTGTSDIQGLDALVPSDEPATKAPAKTPAPKPTSKPTSKTPATTPGAKPKANDDSATSMSQTVDLRFKVIEAVPEGGATVELVYDALKLSMKTAMDDITFDSAQPKEKDGDDPIARMLRSVVGTTLTLKLDKDGNITEVKGGESLLPGGLGGAGADLTSAQGVKSTWGPIFSARRSSGTATVGEKWTTSDSLDSSPMGSFTMTTESVLTSLRAGDAQVDFKGRVEPGKESSREGEGIQIRSASYTGKYLWDTAAGALRSLTSKLSVEASGSIAGAKVSGSQTSETTIERLSGAAPRPADRSKTPAPAKARVQ